MIVHDIADGFVCSNVNSIVQGVECLIGCVMRRIL